MVEPSVESHQGVPLDAAAAHPHAPATAGAWLRAAREAAGLHIGALSVSLKVPVSKLEALEADRLDLLPDAMFARALASSICRALKVDAAEVLRLLPASKVPDMEFAARPAAATVPTRMSDPGRLRLSRVSRPVVVGAGLLVLAAVALLVYPSIIDSTGEGDEVAAPVLASEPPSTPAAAQEGAAPSGTTVVETIAASAASAANTVVPSTAPVPQPAVAASAPVVASAAAMAAPPAQASASDILRITARGSSWVQVTDAAGATPLRRELAAGESVVVAGSLPLAVVVGRVDAVEVKVRGASFDLAPVSRNNMARFQVK